MTLLHGLVYLALLIFLVAIAHRGIRIARTPIHLRWELYPVPHEKGKAKHGGSMLEEVDWWTKPNKKDHLGELGVMAREILLLKGVWEYNRPLWFGSWTLHFGLYLLIGFAALQVFAGAMVAAGAAGTVAFFAFMVLLRVLALFAFLLGTIGSVVMFMRRLTDPKLRMYNTASHYFNLLHLGAIFITGLVWYLTEPSFTAQVTLLFTSLLTWSSLPVLPLAAYFHLAAVLLFIVYLPFTHMTHFFTKYFTYHDVRWEDEPNRPGGKLKGKIKAAVSQPVTWAAPHIQANGKRNWVDLVGMTGNEVQKEENK